MRTFADLGYTSDHVWRQIDISHYQGFTWNLQEKCYNKADGPWGYSNNPLNLTETVNEYVSRKLKQFGEIIELCDDNHFGLLQEADFLFPEYYQRKDAVEKFPKEFVDVFINLKAIFISALDLIHWKLTTYEDKEMAILYSNKLDMVSDSSQSYLEYKTQEESKKVLFCTDFIDIETQQKLTLGTLHGNFNSDYSMEIPMLMRQLQTEDKIIIFGGHTNHPPHYKIDGLLVTDINVCTNFFTDYAQHNGIFNKVYLHDDREEIREKNMIKAYDGFFVIPPLGKDVNIMMTGRHAWSKQCWHDELEEPVLVEGCYEEVWTTKGGKPIFWSEAANKLFEQ